MSLEVKIQLSPEAQAIVKRFDVLPERVADAMRKAMDDANELVLGNVTRDHFTGHGPFPVSQHRLGVSVSRPGHQGGRLRLSLRKSNAQIISGTGLQPQVRSTIGSNVEYLGVHEYGFTGTVNVRAFARRTSRGPARAVFSQKGGKPTLSLRRQSRGTSTVRAHTRKMNVPARAPLSTGVKENLDIYSEKLSAAIIGAINQP